MGPISDARFRMFFCFGAAAGPLIGRRPCSFARQGNSLDSLRIRLEADLDSRKKIERLLHPAA